MRRTISERGERFTRTMILDKHAPVKTRTIVVRPRVPLYTDEIRHAKRERRKAERRWRLSKLDSDLVAFKIKCNAVNNLMHTISIQSHYWGQNITATKAGRFQERKPKTKHVPEHSLQVVHCLFAEAHG